MPVIVRWYLGTALVMFVLALVVGLAQNLSGLLPVHIDILLFGFVIQLAIGMGYWILPRYRGGLRGNETILWITIGLLNLGIWMVTIIGILNLHGQWLAVGRSLEVVAAALFTIQVWKRIRAF